MEKEAKITVTRRKPAMKLLKELKMLVDSIKVEEYWTRHFKMVQVVSFLLWKKWSRLEIDGFWVIMGYT